MHSVLQRLCFDFLLHFVIADISEGKHLIFADSTAAVAPLHENFSGSSGDNEYKILFLVQDGGHPSMNATYTVTGRLAVSNY